MKNRPMTKLSAAAVASILTFALVLAVADSVPATYRAANWGDAINTVPCDAFRKNNDGTWTQTGTIILGDGRGVLAYNSFFNAMWAISIGSTNITLTGNTFGHTGEVAILNERCAH